ncbi:hypothetical protein [Verrucosispora sp. NA02020]|uniref:hypothetical protein n=1 Tax=Verrucosispora sp. NA02020 TaxID=2742132 RepID=UPI003D753B57
MWRSLRLTFLNRIITGKGKPELPKELPPADMTTKLVDRPGVLPTPALPAVETATAVAMLQHAATRRLETIDRTVRVIDAGHEAETCRCSAPTSTRTSMHGACRSTCG